MAKQENINITGIDGFEEQAQLIQASYPELTKRLSGKKIAISVSENGDLQRLGLSLQHINDISIEIARYIISNSGTALYGGDLRQGGFTNYFGELSRQYKIENDSSFRFINYFPFPNSSSITREVSIDFKAKQIKPEVLPIPEKLGDIDINRSYHPNNDLTDRYIFSECFREMRLRMAKDSSARIALGGKLTGYLGFLPGIIEEAWLTLQADKPVYLIGGFGGATAKLISVIKGEEVQELTNGYQYPDKFLKDYKEQVCKEYPWMDYEVLKSEISGFDVQQISRRNKLSIAENEILFSSKNIHEILYLIMKGLRAI